jgi:hypothetical protein
LLKRNKSHVARVNKKHNVEIDSPTPSGCQMKYLKVSLPWPPPEAALSIFNFSFFVKTVFFEKELIKADEIAINDES